MDATAATTGDARRDQLLAWIADSKRRQQRARLITITLIIAAIAVMFVNEGAGIVALIACGSIGFIAFWVTAAHIADWTMQLDHLARTGRLR